ncbi:hypothetical protein [Hymenobacter tenuis]
MLQMISWSQFLSWMAVLLVLYYAYVALFYYRAELVAWVRKQGKGTVPPPPGPSPGLPARGPLITTLAAVLPSAPPSEAETGPAADPAGEEQAEQEPREENEGQSAHPNEEVSAEGEEENNDIIISVQANNDEITSLETTNQPETGAAGQEEEVDLDHTVGVDQLSNYFECAAEGKLTEQEVVEAVPALENTDLLVAFFKARTKEAQRTTSALYQGISEPEAVAS